MTWTSTMNTPINNNDHIYWEDSWNPPKEKWNGEYED